MMMRDQGFYSVRTGINPLESGFELKHVLKIFKSIYLDFLAAGNFQEAFGYDCVDQGFVQGTLGTDIDAALLLGIRKENVWPISERVNEYSQDDLFDVIEFLYAHTAQGVEGVFHNFAECGWHYSEFNREDGQEKFRNRVNPMLAAFADGFELTMMGEILTLPEKGFESIHTATLPHLDPENVEDKVQAAVNKFRRRGASIEDRHDAIRDLVDVLEFLRPKMRNMFPEKDESDLFNIANNFGIRHHNPRQKNDYDKPIWYSWMFYVYLATIHAAMRLIEKHVHSGG